MLTDTPLRLPAIPPGPVLLAYSGGMDSSALLQLLAATPRYRQAGLRALHVHHGLHADADAWAAHCQRSCDALQVPLQIVRVQVERDSGLGLEAAARNARHIAFAHTLAAGEWLTLAHHRDDQAETFLLRALRASGQEGLAAMRPQRPFADGTLWRPLLAHSRADLLAYALAQEVRWIEDPSNADPRHDRNFLRSQVLPLLQQRWPQAADALARSAQLSADASALLLQQDMALLPSVCTASGALDLHALRAQPIERRARLLRAWVSAAHAPPLPAQGVAALEREIDNHAADRQACFAWQQVEVRRWRQRLFLHRPAAAWPTDWQAAWDAQRRCNCPMVRSCGCWAQPACVLRNRCWRARAGAASASCCRSARMRINSNICCRRWTCRHGNARAYRSCGKARRCLPPAIASFPAVWTHGCKQTPQRCNGAQLPMRIDPPARAPHTLAMAKKSLNETSPVARFEQSLEELEQLVQKMEVGDLSLEQSLTAYERGIGLYRDCQQALEQAELRVRLLTDPARPELAQAFEPPSLDG